MTFQPPTPEQLGKYSDEYGLQCNFKELTEYAEMLEDTVAHFNRVQELTKTQKSKHISKRTESYRPKEEENPLNAWYWKTNIRNDTSGLLSGFTVALKDNISVEGVPMMNGSKVLEGFVPDKDATVVSRLLDAGATIKGKATCEELSLYGTSHNTTYGPVRNPWDPKRSTGGSSSGCGVLVANQEVDLAIGGDQGGSVRIPASFCGIVGMKPTYGLVPYTGVVPVEHSVDHIGPMARTVENCAKMLEVMAGYDYGRDSRQPDLEFPVPKYTEELKKPVSGLKIGILIEGFTNCSPDVIKVINDAIQKIEESGSFQSCDEVSVPMHLEGRTIWTVIGRTGVFNQLFKGDGQLDPKLSEKLHDGYQNQMHTLKGAGKMVTLWGAYFNETYGQGIYAKAQTLAFQLRQAYDQVFSSFDVMIMPTLSDSASLLPTEDDNASDKIGRMPDMLLNTRPFNLSRHPALTLNAGYCQSGLPIGIQVVGRRWRDDVVLRVAYNIERILAPIQKPFPRFEQN